MSIPLYIFLIIYLAMVFVFFIFSFFALYHLVRFGVSNFTGFFMTFIYLGVSILILFATLQYINNVNWKEEIPLFNFSVSELNI